MSLHLGDINERLLIFGGPYSNLQATQAVFQAAKKLGVSPQHMVCTGDVVAYCGDPQPTVDLVRSSGAHVVMGNCEESLGNESEDCGCGFEEGSACEILSVTWYEYALQCLDKTSKDWMRGLPREIRFSMCGRRIVVIHGGVCEINEFIFPATNIDVKQGELAYADVDGVVAGHSGVPFVETVSDKLWLNAGVVGMPANDGTPRGWFSMLSPTGDEIEVSLHAFEYDYETAASTMRRNNLSKEYADALGSGLWPALDVMPEADRLRQGVALQECSVIW